MNLAAIATARRRTVTGTFWHQGPTRRDLVSCAHPAVTDGRYHQRGGTGVWYGSDQEQASWSELFRHFTDDGIDPFEVRRRTGRVTVDIDVLDLTDRTIRASIGVIETQLTGEDYRLTRAIAAAADAAGFGGILAPSAALLGRRTLVVFQPFLGALEPERSAVRQPPPRLADLVTLIRLHPDVPLTVRQRFSVLAAAGSEAIRRLRRRDRWTRR